MQSVMNVVMNRVHRNNSSAYDEIMKPEQFSSMTSPGDPQLGLYAKDNDPQWLLAQALSTKALSNVLPDITGGALSYYAVDIPKIPWWAPSMTPTVIIAGQQFLK